MAAGQTGCDDAQSDTNVPDLTIRPARLDQGRQDSEATISPLEQVDSMLPKPALSDHSTLLLRDAQAMRSIAANPKAFAQQYLQRKFETIYQHTSGILVSKIKFLVIGWLFSAANRILPGKSSRSAGKLDVVELEKIGWDLEEYLDNYMASFDLASDWDEAEDLESTPGGGSSNEASPLTSASRPTAVHSETEYGTIPLSIRRVQIASRLEKLVLTHIVETLILCQKLIPQFSILAQEHAIHVAPVIAVGHLSTTVLAATTIAMMVTSITGWSIVKGIGSALDTILVNPSPVRAPTHKDPGIVGIEENEPTSEPPTPSSSSFESPFLYIAPNTAVQPKVVTPIPPPLLSCISETSTLVSSPLVSPFSGASTSTLIGEDSRFESLEATQLSATDRSEAQLWCLRSALIMLVVIPVRHIHRPFFQIPNSFIIIIPHRQPIISLWLNPEPLFNLIDVDVGSRIRLTYVRSTNQDQEVLRLARDYLKVSALGLPAFAFNEVFRRYLDSQGHSSIHAGVITALTPAVMTLNYLLIDGPVERLKLGFIAAPAITAFSYNFIAIMTLLTYLFQRTSAPDAVPQRDQEALEPSSSSVHLFYDFFLGMGPLFSKASIGIISSAMELWSKDVIAVIASLLGPSTLAAQSILLATVSTAYLVPKSISNVSKPRLQKLLQKNDISRTRVAAFIGFVFTLLGVLTVSNLILVYSSCFGKVFSSDEDVLRISSDVLPIITLYVIPHGFTAWIEGVLGAFGHKMILSSLIASADYCAGIPFGLYLTWKHDWGLGGIWLGLAMSNAYGCLMGILILIRVASKVDRG